MIIKEADEELKLHYEDLKRGLFQQFKVIDCNSAATLMLPGLKFSPDDTPSRLGRHMYQ